MRTVLALFVVAVVACSAPVVEPRVACATDADCPDGTICGKGSARENSAKPDAPMIGNRPAECFPPCDTELTDDCALPACPTKGQPIYGPEMWDEGRNRPAGWHDASGEIRLSCGDFDAGLVLTCDFRSGLLALSGGVNTTRVWQDGIKDGCDFIRDRLDDQWWPWSF